MRVVLGIFVRLLKENVTSEIKVKVERYIRMQYVTCSHNLLTGFSESSNKISKYQQRKQTKQLQF